MSEQTHQNDSTGWLLPVSWSELGKRAVSAIILGTVGIGATLAGVWPLAIVVAAISAVLAWEWGRLVRNCTFDESFFLHIVSLIGAVAFAAAGLTTYALAVLAAGFVAIAIWRSTEYRKLSALGVPYIGLAAVGIIWLRLDEMGWAAVLFVFACVWAHDTIAMFVGRAFGGPRLWPSLSPKKTWSGAIAGVSASAVVALLAALVLPTTHIVWVVFLGIVLGIAALLGDLAESGLKRLGRVKNASGLIPGHGGFLDRLDGAIASFAVACLIAAMIDGAEAPARALLQLSH